MHTWIQQDGHRRTRSHQEELVNRHHRKEAIDEEMQARRRRFVACSVSGYGSNSLQCPSIFRFPELLKRTTLDLRTPQLSCLANISKQWTSGATNLTSKSEVELTPLPAHVGECRQMFSAFEKESCPYTSSVSQNIQDTHSHVDSFPCQCQLSLAVTLHTLNDSVIISPLFKSVTNAMKGGMFRLRRSFVTVVARNATTPFVITRREEGRKHTGKKRELEIAEGVVNVLQCNVTTWSEHAKHHILTSDSDAAVISETHLEREKLVTAA